MNSVLPIFLLLCFLGIVISRFSGYHPIGRFNYIHFVFTYPIIEEIVFRGVILPYTSIYVDSAPIGQILYLPITFSVLISAFLFAICHLQYYQWSVQCLRFMIIAFFGGIFYGALANVTESILLTCILHIAFNYFSAFFSERRAKHSICGKSSI
ncbi:CPBP family intramembrane glutamic endopeptidase [Paenibacillus alvei]|uniref:CPBP family intramembrane glutamic endopeptidase n=1 Tax=Paenibacillus alvei TaxID=44250 RepID=UPI003D26510E